MSFLTGSSDFVVPAAELDERCDEGQIEAQGTGSSIGTGKTSFSSTSVNIPIVN